MGEVQRLTNCTTGGPVFVDVEDGRIVRMYPIDLADDDKGDWVIEARGRKFTPPRRTTLSPHAQAQRSMVYSPKRVLYPMKRVDWDPEGERNTQNRGISGYERISWDEALDLVTTELIREKRENGPGSILTTCSSHHLWGNLGYRHSAYYRFLNLMGMVHTAHNPDSWEGWHWGAMPMWGNSHRLGIPEQYDLLEDALKHTEMVVFWSADPESTGGGIYSAFESTSRRYWMKELGIKMVFVDPYYNPTAELFSDKWFAPRLGTDVAFGLGIAHTWLVEGTYDKEYVAERTTGFDEWKDYVLGMTDNVPKTPEWAETECGIPARQIRALAREWGSKKVMLAAGGLGGWGGACRSATGNEWARTMVALAAMQGYGKPGVNIWGTSQGAPSDCAFVFPGYAEGGMSGDTGEVGRRLPHALPHLRPQHRAAPDGQRARLHRGHRHPAPAHPRGDDAREVRVARQGLLRPVHPEPDAEVPVPGAGLPVRHHVLALRRLVLRHHAADQPLREGVPRGRACAPWSTSPSGWRARPSSPTSSCRPAPTSSAGT